MTDPFDGELTADMAILRAHIRELEEQLARMRIALHKAAEDLAIIHDSCGLEVIDTGIQTIAGRACDEAIASLLATSEHATKEVKNAGK